MVFYFFVCIIYFDGCWFNCSGLWFFYHTGRFETKKKRGICSFCSQQFNLLQVGIAGDDCPAEIVPTLIGFNKSPPHGTPVFGKVFLPPSINETLHKPSLLFFVQKVEEEYESRTLLRPVQKGTIVDWENYEIFLDDML